MPKRDVIVPPPTAGLNLVDGKSRLGPGQSYRAENVVFTRGSVRRRRGKKAAYQRPAAISSAVNLAKRFYKLATTGSVDKYLFLGTLARLFRSDSDWSDDTGTTITSWTECQLPSNVVTGNNTLYDGYSSPSTVTVTDNALQTAVTANSWLYLQADFDITDDASETKNVPLRTQGVTDGQGTPEVECFLHGLVPPASVDTSDFADHNNTPQQWNFEEVDVASSASVDTSVAFHSNGDIHVAWIDTSGGSTVKYTKYDGSWSATEDVSTTPNPAGFVSLAVDSLGRPAVAWYDADPTTQDLNYASKPLDVWIEEEVDSSTANIGDFCRLRFNGDDQPEIVYMDATNSDIKEAVKSSAGTWTTQTVASHASDVYQNPDFILDSDGNGHCIYHDFTNQDLLYRKRTSGSWGAAETIDNAVGAPGVMYCRIDLDSDDVPHVMYNGNGDVKYNNNGSSWSAGATVDSSGSNDFDNGSFVLDAQDVPYGAWQVGNVGRVASLANSSWTVRDLHQDQTTIGTSIELVISPVDDSIHLFYPLTASPFQIQHAEAEIYRYWYALTAEYDDLNLGESGPSGKTRISFTKPIDSINSHDFDLSTGSLYDMTDEVTAIYVYRTVAGSSSSATYYRAGTVSCSSGDGIPDGDFTDNVKDSDLVLNRVLDEDVYLPPKYRTSAYWKDRLIIAHTKTRTTLDDTGLDAEAGGIHKNRIRFSEAFQPDRFRANFFQDVVPDTDSGSITRLIVNPVIDSLFVFMENDVVALTDPIGDLKSSLSFRPRTISGARGTPARKGVLHHEGRIFYVTKSGVDVVEGYASRNITSRTIGPLWNQDDSSTSYYLDRMNMDRLDQVVAGLSTDYGRELIYFAYPAELNSYNNRVLVLHYDLWKMAGFRGDPPWSLYAGWDISEFCRWDGEGDRGEIFGGESNSTDQPWLYRLDRGDSDINGNNTPGQDEIAIPDAYLYPGYTDADRPDLLKAWVSARVDVRGGGSGVFGRSSLNLQFDIDEGVGSFPISLDSYDVPGFFPSRDTRMIPRSAIGVHGGCLLQFSDTLGASGNPVSWELYGIAYTVRDIRSRHRGYRT